MAKSFEKVQTIIEKSILKILIKTVLNLVNEVKN